MRCDSALSKIENDKTNPSPSMLHKIGATLDVNVAALFADKEPRGKIVMRAGQRPMMMTDEVRRGNGLSLERLVPYAKDRLPEGIINIIQPDGGSDVDVQHDGEELGYGLDGVFDLKVNGEAYRLGPGDSFCLRSELPHSYRNPGSSVTRVVWVNTPPTF